MVYMDPRLWIYQHFDLNFNSNINVKHTNNYTLIFKKYGE